MNTTVAIVEDHEALGKTLRKIVESDENCQCVGVWSSGEEALIKIPAFQPQVHIPVIRASESRRIDAPLPQHQLRVVAYERRGTERRIDWRGGRTETQCISVPGNAACYIGHTQDRNS